MADLASLRRITRPLLADHLSALKIEDCNVSVCPSYGRERKLQILDWSQSSGRLHFSIAVDNTLDASPVARLAGPLPGLYCLLVPLDVTWKPARALATPPKSPARVAHSRQSVTASLSLSTRPQYIPTYVRTVQKKKRYLLRYDTLRTPVPGPSTSDNDDSTKQL